MTGPKARSLGGSGKTSHEVGYGKPPAHTQFRPGQSGNPAGRRKGLRNLVTDVKTTLATPVKVREGGRTRTKSTQEGVLMVLREKALRGDARSLELLIQLAGRFNTDGSELGSTQSLATDDQAILAAYLAERSAVPTSREATRFPDDPKLKSSSGAAKRAPK